MSLDTLHFEKTETNKSAIEKNIAQFENKKTIEQQEENVTHIVFEDIKKEWLSEYFPKWIESKKVDNDTFLIIDTNTNKPYIFVDSKWEMLINLPIKYRETYIKTNSNWNPWRAMLKSGFVFWQNKVWSNLDLYKIVWYKNWQLEFSWKIDLYSKEYYQAWKKIVYNQWILEIKTALESDDKTPYNHYWIEALLDSWAMTKEVLDQFKEKWIVSQEDYEYWLNYLEKQNRESVDRAIEEIKNRVK